MLSVLIPTYNEDCTRLVENICREGRQLDGGFELIVEDDASPDDGVRLAVDQLGQMPDVRVIRNKVNLGRAKGRNLLAREAKGDILLFIDSDALVPQEFSLKTYVDALSRADVVCGGLRHPDVNPCPQATLRFKYEKEADKCRLAEIRNQNPYQQISTFSLMLRKDFFLSILFDELCTDYGYEDTLFGAELERRGAKVLHIDNPLIHNGLEPNDVFLNKTERALHTLKKLEHRMQHHSHLLQTADKLRRWHIAWWASAAYKLFRHPLKNNLLGKNPSLKAFSFYKLGYYLSLK